LRAKGLYTGVLSGPGVSLEVGVRRVLTDGRGGSEGKWDWPRGKSTACGKFSLGVGGRGNLELVSRIRTRLQSACGTEAGTGSLPGGTFRGRIIPGDHGGLAGKRGSLYDRLVSRYAPKIRLVT